MNSVSRAGVCFSAHVFGSASGDEGLTSSIHLSELQLSACVQACVRLLLLATS